MCTPVAQGLTGGIAAALPAPNIAGKLQKKVASTVNDVLPEKTVAGKLARTAQDIGPKLYN